MDATSMNYSSQELLEFPEVVNSSIQSLILDFNNISLITPTVCSKLSHLKCLSMNGNFLETLPLEIVELVKLTELHLKENEIYQLPDSIGYLQFLSILHLTGNPLKNLPENFCSLQNLTELIANENEIECLPYDFGRLCCLRYLDLSSNKISCLPASFGNLENLKKLDLSNNCLTDLPDSFEFLPSLEVLDFTHNKISILPKNFSSARILRKFIMSNNHLTSLPSWFADLKNICEIFLDCNCLQHSPFPENFGADSVHLIHLDLSGNNITDLPEKFGNLKSLQYLDLGSPEDELERSRFMANGNSVHLLPSSFSNLSCLTNLQLDENEISELPDNFGNLENIEYLDLGHNTLKTLPNSFYKLKRMKICMLSMNYLICLPKEFGLLTSLEDLKLDNNLLTEVPESFECLTELVSLDLFKNKLTDIPKALNALKKLKHLDLRENNIDLGLDELPEIFYAPTYLRRDPNKSSNWRGRIREDIQHSFWVDSKEKKMDEEKTENETMYQALKSSSALWRKHGQDDSRLKINTRDVCSEDKEHELEKEVISSNSSSEGYFSVSQSETDMTDNDCQVQSSDKGNNGDSAPEVEFWDDDFLPTPPRPDVPSTSINDSWQDAFSDDSDSSDWERSPRVNAEAYRHHTVSSGYPALFLPSDLHPPRVQTTCFWYQEEDGQFDDDDL